jgi:hypothetical protein
VAPNSSLIVNRCSAETPRVADDWRDSRTAALGRLNRREFVSAMRLGRTGVAAGIRGFIAKMHLPVGGGVADDFPQNFPPLFVTFKSRSGGCDQSLHSLNG